MGVHQTQCAEKPDDWDAHVHVQLCCSEWWLHWQINEKASDIQIVLFLNTSKKHVYIILLHCVGVGYWHLLGTSAVADAALSSL